MTFQAAGGVQEREVRRRADPAKAAVERFIRKWRGQTLVMGEPSYGALVGASSRVTRLHTVPRAYSATFLCAEALRILGDFYQRNGSRAALTQETASRVLDALQAAQTGLSE